MLFKTTSEFMQYLPVNVQLDINTLKPFIQQAERDSVIPYLSQDQYDDLNDAYNADSPDLTDAQQTLLNTVQPAIAFFAFKLYLPYGQVQISDAGIRIASDEIYKTAFQWQIDDLATSATMSAHSAMDALLDLLENNQSSYKLWAASDSFTLFNELFIQTTKQFDDIFNIGKSRSNFLALKAVMRYVHTMYFNPLLGEDYYNDLVEKVQTEDLNDHDNVIFPDLQAALAHLTIYEAIDRQRVEISEYGIIMNEYKAVRDNSREKTSASDNLLLSMKSKAQADGRMYLDKVKFYLNAKASSIDYPLYFDSDVYVDPTQSDPNEFQNSADSGLIIL
jgi:hypothetical protein